MWLVSIKGAMVMPLHSPPPPPSSADGILISPFTSQLPLEDVIIDHNQQVTDRTLSVGIISSRSKAIQPVLNCYMASEKVLFLNYDLFGNKWQVEGYLASLKLLCSQ